MASSGWQGQHTIWDASYPHMRMDVFIDSIEHSGTNLRIRGSIAVIVESGYLYYNGVSVWWPNGSGSTDVNGGAGTTGYVSFDTTVQVSVSATSYSFTAGSSASWSGGGFNGSSSWTLYFSASGTAPSGLAVTYVSNTWNSVTGSVTLSSYGTPSSDANRYIEFGVVDPSNSEYGSPYRYKIKKAVNSETFTVTNSDYGAFVIKGCIGYKVGGWATNTVMSTKTLDSTVRYTPPAPGQLSYTDEGNGSWRVVYTGVAANNSTSYTASDLVRTFRYKDSSSSTWTYVQQDTQAAITDVTISYIPISPQHTVEIEAWMTYKGGRSEVSSTTITNDAPAAHLYGSVPGQVRNESAEIEKLYGAIQGTGFRLNHISLEPGSASSPVVFENEAAFIAQVDGDSNLYGYINSGMEITRVTVYYNIGTDSYELEFQLDYATTYSVSDTNLADWGLSVQTAPTGSFVEVLNIADASYGDAYVTKKITKLYASVGGVTKLIFEDNS